MAAAYKARARDKSVVTPEIQKLADELTAGLSDKREQTKRLYQWVARNVRYVAMALGDGGYVQVLVQRAPDAQAAITALCRPPLSDDRRDSSEIGGLNLSRDRR